MRTERDVKDPPTRTFQRRRTLSNITNLSLSASWATDVREGLKAKTPSKTISFSESQLREENTALKRLLSEKDATIELQAAQLDQMQKEFFAQLRRQTQVNEELISYNSRLSKDGGQLRDQLKLIQHEYCQMTVAYRINQSELQVKLTESQELVMRLLEQANKPSTDQSIPSKVQKKLRGSSAHRRHSIANVVIEEDWNESTKGGNRSQPDGVKKSDLSRRLPSVSKEKIGGSRQTQPRADDQVAAAPVRTPNLYCDLIGLDPMPEGSCEDDNDSPRASTCDEATSNASDDSSAKAGSGLTSESTSRRPKSGCIESTFALGKGAARPGNTKNPDQRVSSSSSSSDSSSGPTPHFSRRMAINSSLSTENGRPLRRAVVKIASYTEPALNTKMRRPS